MNTFEKETSSLNDCTKKLEHEWKMQNTHEWNVIQWIFPVQMAAADATYCWLW